MNKKGFTTVELVVSFVLVVIILITLVGFTVNYRDKVKIEQIKSKLIDFKNTVTKAVYDDITEYNIQKIEYCVGDINCVNFVDSSNNFHTLKIFYECKNNIETCLTKDYRTYLSYDNIKYELPDSDINKYAVADGKIYVNEKACDFDLFELSNYSNSIYSLKIVFSHYMFDDNYEILLTVN